MREVDRLRHKGVRIGIGVDGSRHIFGVMVESHLQAGAQKFSPGKDDPAKLAYGQSITDACIGWEHSLQVLDALTQAVQARRR